MENMQLRPKTIQHKASETISMAWMRNNPAANVSLCLKQPKRLQFYRCLSDICRYFSIIVSDAHSIGHHRLAFCGRVEGAWPPCSLEIVGQLWNWAILLIDVFDCYDSLRHQVRPMNYATVCGCRLAKWIAPVLLRKRQMLWTCCYNACEKFLWKSQAWHNFIDNADTFANILVLKRLPNSWNEHCRSFEGHLSPRFQYKSSAVAEMGDHSRHGPKRGGGCCAPFTDSWDPV